MFWSSLLSLCQDSGQCCLCQSLCRLQASIKHRWTSLSRWIKQGGSWRAERSRHLMLLEEGRWHCHITGVFTWSSIWILLPHGLVTEKHPFLFVLKRNLHLDVLTFHCSKYIFKCLLYSGWVAAQLRVHFQDPFLLSIVKVHTTKTDSTHKPLHVLTILHCSVYEGSVRRTVTC